MSIFYFRAIPTTVHRTTAGEIVCRKHIFSKETHCLELGKHICASLQISLITLTKKMSKRVFVLSLDVVFAMPEVNDNSFSGLANR